MQISDSHIHSPDPTKISFWRPAATTGGWIALVSILISLITYVTGLSDAIIKNKSADSALNILNALIFFAFVFWGIQKHRRNDLMGWMSVGRGVAFGAVAGLVAGVLGAIWTYIYFDLLDPHSLELIHQRAMQEMADRGLSEGDIEQQMKFTRPFMQAPFMSISVLVISIILGVISGLIAGAVLQKK